MMRTRMTTLAIATLLGSFPAVAEDLKTTLIDDAKLNLQFRARFEQVDVEAQSKQDQTTLRTRLTYQSGDLYNFFTLAEVDDVRSGDDEPMIADYQYTEINQAYIGYRAPADSVLKYGRQRILLDNQRFVGGVGFRQNEQTYDGFSAVSTGVQDLKAFYAYINNVNRIFSEDSGKSDHKNKTHLFNLHYGAVEAAQLTGYAYLIDNLAVARFSTDTYGVRLTGKTDIDPVKLSYALEYATQSNGGNNTLDYRADYLSAEARADFSAVGLKLGYEVLGSDDGKAGFITPLATLHKFQGWTDKFLFGGAGNWDKGITDTYIAANTSLAGVKLLLVYHTFESDVGNIDMGQEWGISAGYKFANYYNASIKYAAFSGADAGYGFSADTDKLWLTLEAKF
ncbi:alginate export family protein [Shewanella submarina]|uniref:Alginate export family protein n=1 Tax=Shewanella submarina TaxID=2016376 RepID=A0ABV7GGJ8_9GAMM|nr:alginate export family protein [Shewanella submarina]MCL1036341.1 alginate export family protein [Shewanella submarina]